VTSSRKALRVSVVIPTRNRRDHALACATSVLANTGFVELVVVDQSDDTSTEEAIRELRDPRLRYVRTPTRGVSNSRNLGIELTDGDIIAFTDDDCRAAPDWVQNLARVFESDPQAAVVCGQVRVPEELYELGFAESFEPKVREVQGEYPPFGGDWGITANLAVRRDVVARVGNFDPILGAGAPLRSGEEPDFIFRVLRAGLKVVNAREASVDHLGVRTPGAESRRLIRGYGVGTGAAFFKHVRLGDLDALGVYLGFIGANVRRAASGMLRGKRPEGLGYLYAFLSGSVTSWKYKIDPELKRYVPR
jgi:glycosyltransferase involved in cell wall biosynthesis